MSFCNAHVTTNLINNLPSIYELRLSHSSAPIPHRATIKEVRKNTKKAQSNLHKISCLKN